MYFKLSFKNVRKSFRDYMLYFATLTFAVCVFYVFNSIEAQQAMLNLSESASAMIKNLASMISIISVFISFILGFLIVYANNFLIRRRKKELGIYMTLGMDKGKISRILVTETIIIGFCSLGIGLLAGVFFSQWLSIFTAKLFEADMTKYQFIFSGSAFFKTILYFGIIFVIVMVISTFVIGKYKLIDLINASKQNEKPRLKSPVLTVILFILSIACLGVAYGLVLKNGIMNFDGWLLFEVILGSIGTFLFFASLSGFFLSLIKASKRRYYKGLNMFVLRQINSRINTAHISMSLICLMLFCTIGILSTGLGINGVMDSTLKNGTPFDISITAPVTASMAEALKAKGVDLAKYTDRYTEFGNYQKDGLNMSAVLNPVKPYWPKEVTPKMLEQPLLLLKVSEFNALMKLQNKDELTLSDSSVALYSDYAASADSLNKILVKFLDGRYPVNINGKDYSVNPKLMTDSISTAMGSNFMSLIVPDSIVEGITPVQKTLNFNCKGDSAAMQQQITNDFTAFYNADPDGFDFTVYSKNQIKDSYTGAKAIISYLGIYIGIIFLLTSAAVLALQQLSEVSDNRQRYAILKKIGADDKLINGAIFKQTLIYFALPLALACVHSVVGLKVANEAVSAMGDLDIVSNTLITAAMILVVYGGYFLATYLGGKNMILRNVMRNKD